MPTREDNQPEMNKESINEYQKMKAFNLFKQRLNKGEFNIEVIERNLLSETHEIGRRLLEGKSRFKKDCNIAISGKYDEKSGKYEINLEGSCYQESCIMILRVYVTEEELFDILYDFRFYEIAADISNTYLTSLDEWFVDVDM